MNRLKPVFFSLFMIMLAAGILFSALRMAIEGPNTPWLGLALASIVPGAYFMHQHLAQAERSNRDLRWMPLLGLIAACIPVTLAPNQPWPLITALLNGVVGPALYARWYLRSNTDAKNLR